MTKKTMKASRYYAIETILDGAIRCEAKKDGFGEGKYYEQAIGFVFALSSAGIINGREFKIVTEYITHGCYENAKLDLKHILTDGTR